MSKAGITRRKQFDSLTSIRVSRCNCARRVSFPRYDSLTSYGASKCNCAGRVSCTSWYDFVNFPTACHNAIVLGVSRSLHSWYATATGCLGGVVRARMMLRRRDVAECDRIYVVFSWAFNGSPTKNPKGTWKNPQRHPELTLKKPHRNPNESPKNP